MSTSLYSSIFSIRTIKQYARMDETESDETIQALAHVAESYATQRTGILISKQKVISYGLLSNDRRYKLMHKPVLQILSIEIDDIFLLSDQYNLMENYIYFSSDQTGKIVVNAMYGHNTTDELNAMIKIAILSHISHLYNNRTQNNISFIPKDVDMIYKDFQNIKL